MSKDKISIMLPVFNRASTLREALDSIVNQSYENWKIVALDDGSSDKSFDVLKEYEKMLGDKFILLVHVKRRGLPSSVNDMYKYCDTEYVTWLSSDDFYYPEKLENDFNFMEKNKNVDVLWTSFNVINEDGNILYKANNYFPSDLLEKQMPKHFEVSWVSICFRKKTTFDILKNTDGFVADEIFKTTADWDINIRLSKFCNFKYMDKISSVWRVHKGQGTHTEEADYDNDLMKKRVSEGFYDDWSV